LSGSNRDAADGYARWDSPSASGRRTGNPGRNGLWGKPMADTDLSTEQSMDEILKKIERKLVEDDKPEPPAAPQSAEVLKLADADTRKARAQNRGRPPAAAGQDGSPRGAPEPATGEANAEEIAAAALAGVPRERSALDEPGPAIAETLEDVVRELVKPMLRSWLDEKLGAVLNRLVQAELSKALEEVQTP
jgi:hypothetical protein